MNVVLASSSFDIGGQGQRIAAAFRNVAGWTVRSVSKTATYLSYPVDTPYRRKALDELYQACDVFHSRVNFKEYDRLAAKYGPKPVVLHAHGSAFRANPNQWVRMAKERNAVILCSTLDLYLLAPEVSVWLPSPYDVDALRTMRG